VHARPQGTTTNWGFLPNGRAEFRGVTMLDLISTAYGVPTERTTAGGDGGYGQGLPVRVLY
jgi:hypothetical protein